MNVVKDNGSSYCNIVVQSCRFVIVDIVSIVDFRSFRSKIVQLPVRKVVAVSTTAKRER